jgi:hypothetical protein
MQSLKESIHWCVELLLAVIVLLAVAFSASAQDAFATTPQEDIRSAMHVKHDSIYGHRDASPELTKVAQWYADYLHSTGQRGHYAWGTPWSRAAGAGFRGTLLFNERLGDWYWTGVSYKRVVHHDAGEILCFDARSIDDAFAGWLDSTGHRAALMEPSFDVCGFGQRGTVFVGLFGNSKAVPAAATTPAKPVVMSAGGPTTCQVAQSPHGGPVRGVLARGRGAVGKAGQAVRGVGRRLLRPLSGRLRGGC